MSDLVWLIPVFPLIGFLIIGLLNKRLPKPVAGIIGSLAVFASFCVAVGIFMQLQNGEITSVTKTYFEWLRAGNLRICFSFLIDPLSSLMLLIVTGVGFLIHVYSAGYMSHDEGYNRFFAYMNLFIVFMLLLVLGSNYVVMFAGWEGVGLCSYLLIGFWFKNTDYNNAAKKAFIMNRIGDLGFLLGMFLIFTTFGTLEYGEIFPKAFTMASNEPVLVAITLLLFIGAMGKSAQLPLYTWLPDAMAGPTPVSALIHAATMVTAGVYMIARSNILYTLAPTTLGIVAAIGCATALFAATIGLVQNDIKKVLAYSTVSQLGFMFVALGVGAYTTGMFHVTTHAFFKALLFLGAGSVIHAMSNEQDIRKMGGLKKYLPITYWTFLVATLAISGIFPFAGFFSKDEILAKAFEHNIVLYAVLTITSVLTAFYMFRVFYLTFHGTFRGTEEQKHHLHESPTTMTIPLVILGILSVIGGFIGIPAALHGSHWLNKFLEPVFLTSNQIQGGEEMAHSSEMLLMGVALGLALAIIYIARNKYISKNEVPVAEDAQLSFAHKTAYNKYYIDELYTTIIVKPVQWLSNLFYKVFDIQVIDNLVNGVGRSVVWSGKNLRLIQTGNVGFYIFAMVLGIVAILALSFLI